jgi:hypothetical protein
MKSSATHQSRICFFHSRQHKVELAPSQMSIQYKQQALKYPDTFLPVLLSLQSKLKLSFMKISSTQTKSH